jgi:REP element-mobilizing transposase RayT
MAHSRTVILVHCVWSTRYRKNVIPQKLLNELWPYFVGIGRNKRIPVLAAGGMPNHVHLAVSLPPTKAVAEVISIFKANSSSWLKRRGVKGFEWQTGIWRVQLTHGSRAWANTFRPSGWGVGEQYLHHKISAQSESYHSQLARNSVNSCP